MTEQVLKKKAIPMGVDADIEQHAIIVHYEQQTIYGDKDGNILRTEKKPHKKSIVLGEFQKDDVLDIAEEVMRSCNLINPQRKDLLLKALNSLVTGVSSNTLGGDASMDKLDEYVDAMYDELQVKIEATAKIQQLSQQNQNLNKIAGNGVLIAALARVLRDDGMKSIELGTNIAHTFYLISHQQKFGLPLLEQKTPESLFKMIEQECKRYQTYYKKLSEMRQVAQKSEDQKQKANYQLEYDKFKKLITTQDKLLYVALMTIVNLTETQENRVGKVDLFYQMDKLVQLLSQILGRKPPNNQLVLTCLNYLQRISCIQGGIQEINKAGALKQLLKLFESDQELFEHIIKLLYNLAFDPDVRQELAESEIFQKLDELFLELNNELLLKYQGEFDPNLPLQEKIALIIKNHDKRQEDDETKDIIKRAAQLSKFVMLMANDDGGVAGFAKTNIGSNLTAMTCLLKNQEKDIMKTLQQLAIDPRIAAKIAKNNLLSGLTDQFTRTKDPVFMQLFTGLAGAIPQDQRVGKQNATKGGSDGNSGGTAQQLYENAAKIADIAIQSGDKQLEKQALQLMAQAPAKHIQAEQAQKITKMAINALNPEEKDMEKKISAVGVIAMMMSRANNVQDMCNNGDLKKLPDQLLDIFKEAMGKTVNSQQALGLDFKTVEYDLLVTVLISILKACSYKVLRKEFLQRPQFLPFIVRMLFNQPRPGNDTLGFRPEKREENQTEPQTPADELKSRTKTRGREKSSKTSENSTPLIEKAPKGSLKPLLIHSKMETVEQRVLHVLEALADLILDVLMFSEPTTMDQIRLLKFQRYHYDFCQKAFSKK